MTKIYTKDEYSKAYTELLQILKYISLDDFNKIPNDLIQYFEQNKDLNYEYKYDVEIPFEEQKILRLTKILIANLYVKYWTTDDEKKLIKEQDEQYLIGLEKEKRERYNPDNLFKPIEDKVVDPEPERSLAVVKNKNIISKVIEKIRKILNLT